jgi:hypothetical protein
VKPLMKYIREASYIATTVCLLSPTCCQKSDFNSARVARPRTSFSIVDIEQQITDQFRRAWPELTAVSISHFERPSGPHELIIGLRLTWSDTPQTSTHTSARFYQAGSSHYVGHLELEGKGNATALLSFPSIDSSSH